MFVLSVVTGFFRTVTRGVVSSIKHFKDKKEQASERSVEVDPAIEPAQATEPEEPAVVSLIGRYPVNWCQSACTSADER